MSTAAAVVFFLVAVALAAAAPSGAASGSPTAAFTVSPNPTIGQPVTFDGSGSTCSASPCTYKWNDDGGEPPKGNWPLGTGVIIHFTFTGSAFTAYVRLTVTDARGQTATIEHNVNVAAAPAPSNSAAPAISGSPVVGQTLSTTNGTWTGSPTSYKYQWEDCGSSGSGCAAISGATSSTYVVAGSDVGKTLVAVVTATNGSGSASAASQPTAVVTGPPTAAFTVSPNPTIGQPVTFDGSGSSCSHAPCTYKWDDDGGEPPTGNWPLGTGQVIQYTFQGSAFTAYVRLTVTDAAGETATVEHNVNVAASAAPSDTVAPTINGSPTMGQTLTASNGSWTGSPTSYAYQWNDCNSSGSSCTGIAGATSSSYQVASSDTSHTLMVAVTATNSSGSATADSAPTAMVSSGGSSSTSQLSGTAEEGQPLSAPSGGSAYQWYDCDSVGRNCSAISGATGASYTPVWSDVGHTEYVAETTSSGTLNSELSPAVAWQPSSPSAGNLWVSATSGGSCTRSSSAVAFNQATSCNGLAAAYQAAQCGDTILVESGNYSATPQEIRDKTALDSCAAPVLMTAGPGQSPIFGEVNDGNFLANARGGSNLIIYNIAITGASGSTDRITAQYATNVVFEDIHGGAFYVNDAHHVLIENSNFGPCATGTVASGGCHSNSKIDAGGFTAAGHTNTSDVTVRGNTFHDFSCNSSGCHFECIFTSGGTGIMIDSNTFARCQLQTVFIQPATSTTDWLNYLTIQNNWIMQDEDSANNPRQYAIDTGSNNGPPDNVVVRYNSFDATSGITNSSGSVGNMQIVGNILPSTSTAGCISGATYSYNIFLGNGTCGTGTTVSSLPYVNTTAGSQDFHLTCGSTAKGYVTPTTGMAALAYDHNGGWRAASGPREAGSEVEASCGT